MKNKTKKIMIILLLFIVGSILTLLGFKKVKTKKFFYNENNSINYKVYLKENNFFENEYLEENGTYITSLINYIDIDFHYQINFSEPVDMNTKYYLIATVSANKINEPGTYWSKKYTLTNIKEEQYQNQNKININENIKIDYNTYNEILESFKQTYKLSTNGILNVALYVENESKTEMIEIPINIVSQIDLDIPLLQQSVEIAINKKAENNNKEIKINEKKNILKQIFKIIGPLLIIIDTIITLKYIINKKNKNKNYKTILNKILSSNDSIIVTLDEMPDIDKLNKVKVKSFNELLDVYSEVRMPINYYEKQEESLFFIIDEAMIWTYTLKNKDIEGFYE